MVLRPRPEAGQTAYLINTDCPWAFRMPQLKNCVPPKPTKKDDKKAPELAPALGVLRSERLITNVGAEYVTEVAWICQPCDIFNYSASLIP